MSEQSELLPVLQQLLKTVETVATEIVAQNVTGWDQLTTNPRADMACAVLADHVAELLTPVSSYDHAIDDAYIVGLAAQVLADCVVAENRGTQ